MKPMVQAAQIDCRDMVISICVCTYRRAERLALLLADLCAQDTPIAEVVVVDNDATESARAVVEARRAAGCPFRLIYAIQPERNIALTRNRTVELASGEWLAFIDDDERAEPGWLAALHAKMSDPTVAAAVGIVHFIFAEDVPIHRRECALYKVLDFEDGQDLEWWGTWIGNSCLRRN